MRISPYPNTPKDSGSLTAPFAVDRAAHGRAVSNGYLDAAESYTRVHVLPAWGTWRLQDFTTRRLDSWVIDLHRCGELAPATINKIVQALRTILERAVDGRWITENPADHVKSVRVRHPERRSLHPLKRSATCRP